MQPSTFHNIMLLYDCILGNSHSRRMKVKNIPSQQPNAQAKVQASTGILETTEEFSQSFLERGGFKFLATFFTALDKNGLESSTLLNKALTMVIEIVN